LLLLDEIEGEKRWIIGREPSPVELLEMKQELVVDLEQFSPKHRKVFDARKSRQISVGEIDNVIVDERRTSAGMVPVRLIGIPPVIICKARLYGLLDGREVGLEQLFALHLFQHAP
jgi:hypothetical protein